jgi:hypothetical protein
MAQMVEPARSPKRITLRNMDPILERQPRVKLKISHSLWAKRGVDDYHQGELPLRRLREGVSGRNRMP